MGKLTSISNTKNKTGRLDVLLHGVAGKLLEQLENKTSLPGLREGILPIVESEIKKHIPSGKVIPKEYENLTKLIGSRLKIGA